MQITKLICSPTMVPTYLQVAQIGTTLRTLIYLFSLDRHVPRCFWTSAILAVFSGTTDCTSGRIKKGQPGVISQNLASYLQSIHIGPHHGEDLIDLGLWALVDGPQELLLLVPVSRGLI